VFSDEAIDWRIPLTTTCCTPPLGAAVSDVVLSLRV
jgi:hypothetical protein